MKKKRILLFCTGIDDVLSGSSKVAGIQVQMSFWARTFVKHGWDVYSFTDKETRDIDGIHFVNKSKSHVLVKLHLTIIQEWIDCMKCISMKPDVVIYRGASRCLFLLSRLCRYKHIQFILFGASDTDFVPGKEIVGGSRMNRKLYQKALGQIECFVTQNLQQHNTLLENYGKDSLIVSNIWLTDVEYVSEKLYDAIWIANFRPLKRAEWFVKLAVELPQYKFAMVGGSLVKEYYDQVEQCASNVNNLIFMGPQPFNEVCHLLAQSRLLVCTSEFEGFPNTFLQAWANGVPVVSTVDPSGVVTKYDLGRIVSDEDQLYQKVKSLLELESRYDGCVKSIGEYFNEHHSAEKAIENLFNYIQ